MMTFALKITIIVAALLSSIVALRPSPSEATHATFVDRNTFVRFMDSSLGGNRSVATCTDGLNGNSEAKAQFRLAVADWNLAAGFVSYALYGSGETLGACNGTEKLNAHWTSTSPCVSGWVGCAYGDGLDSAGGFTTAQIRINSTKTFSSLGLKGVMTHELGHIYGLWEQYDETNPVPPCNGNVTSIMERSTVTNGVIVSQCGSTQTRPFDYTNVQNAFNKTFSPTPTPQILWIQTLSTSTLRVTFKVPSAGSRSYQRTLCGGAFPAAQSITVVQGDVAYANFPVAASPTAPVCAQLRVVGGTGGSGVHYGRLNGTQGYVTAGWATVYSMSSQQAIMRNNSSSTTIPRTRVTTSQIVIYPRCPNDVPLPALQTRVCNLESFGTGTIWWWSGSPSGGSFDSMNAP